MEDTFLQSDQISSRYDCFNAFKSDKEKPHYIRGDRGKNQENSFVIAPQLFLSNLPKWRNLTLTTLNRFL